MEFSTNRDELAYAISIVEKFVPSKTPIPILSGIKFYISDGRLNLASTDIDMGINYTMDEKHGNFNIQQEGAMVVNAKVLSEIVRKLPSGCIDFLLEGSRLTVNAGELKMVLSCNDADDFPEISKQDVLPCLRFSQKVFKDMIKQTIYARSDDYTLRPQLTGILVECVDGILNMVCLDGYRIAWRWEEIEDSSSPAGNFSVIVPGQTMLELTRIFSDDDDDFMMMLGKNRVEFRNENMVISSRVLEGNFLDYRKVMNIEKKTCVVTQSSVLSSAIERALVLAREGSKNNLFKLKISSNVMEVSAESEMGSIQEKIHCSTEGEELLIAFNARFFIDILRTIDNTDARLTFSGDTGPCIITPKDSEKQVNFILPVKLRGEGV
jgi:DNA polymerase-3 subunit beta